MEGEGGLMGGLCHGGLMGHLERAADGRRSVPLPLLEQLVSSSFRTTIQQSGRGRRRGRTLLQLCKQFSTFLHNCIWGRRKIEKWHIARKHLWHQEDKGGREKCSETPFETRKVQSFSANLRTPRYVMSSEVKQLDFVFTCKHFTCWKYGISNDLSVSNIPHKAAVILKFKWNRT